MPREQVEVLRCDRCSNSGTVYVVSFDAQGSKEFVLCDKHNGPLERLKGVDYGTWKDAPKKRKRGITKVKLEDIT